MKIVFILFCSLITFHLFSCSCFGKSGLQSNDDVFIAKVIKIELREGINHVTLKVKKVFKGTLRKGEKITITTNMSGASCGFHFLNNLNYTVYSKFKGVSLCSKTRLLLPFERYFYRAKKDAYFF